MEESFKLNSGARIPALGFGTYKIAPEHAFEAVSHALRLGYRHIDTATIYRNEEEVGRAVRESGIQREQLFVTTKLWNSDHGNPRAAFDASLKRLGLDYVDLYLQHWPTPQRVASWKVMEQLVDEGLAKHIGVSNFTIRHLQDFLPHVSLSPSVNQFEMHPFLYQKDLLDYCKEKGMVVQAYSPLVRGARMNHETLASVARAHSKTPSQILLRWCLQHGALPLPRSTNPVHIEENLRVFDFTLSDSEMQKLNALHEGYRVAPDPTNLP